MHSNELPASSTPITVVKAEPESLAATSAKNEAGSTAGQTTAALRKHTFDTFTQIIADPLALGHLGQVLIDNLDLMTLSRLFAIIEISLKEAVSHSILISTVPRPRCP